MKKTTRSSPRSEPDRIYQEFCQRRNCRPGNLNLPTKLHFREVAGWLVIIPKREQHLSRLKPVFQAWQIIIRELTRESKTCAEDKTPTAVRLYLNRRRPPISDKIWQILSILYWNYAAWIILRGEYKAMKANLSEHEIEEQLRKRYGYLSQVQTEGWFMNMKNTEPLILAHEDTAKSFGFKSAESLLVMLSPGRLKKSPPASLILADTNSQKLLSSLERGEPRKRTRQEKTLINLINSKYYKPE
jgi:hypothetical protein